MNALEKIMSHPSQEWRIYEAAMWYAEMGIYIVPVVKNGKRLPSKEYNTAYQHASRNRKVLEKWFDPMEGTFAGWNIGIACGREGGVFAVDIDNHGGVDGELNFKRAMEIKKGEMPDAPTQVTPSGGIHYLFQWQENAVSSTNKIAPSVDTRGGTSDRCKGHIVAFPSVINGQSYQWIHWPDTGLPTIPEWIIGSMGAAWSPPLQSGIGRGSEEVTDQDIEENISREQVERMLSFIDPNDCDYDKWIKIGMSIKSQFQGDDGLEIWDNWSSKGEKYEKDECYIRWQGFDDFGAIRAGTLFHYATNGGWEKEIGEESGNIFDKVVSEMNETYAVAVVGGKIRILREKDDVQEMDMHYELLDKDGFKTLLQNQKMTARIGGKMKSIGVADIWLGHAARRTYRNGLALFPDNVVPNGYYNTWRGFSVTPKEGEIPLFIEHVENVICDSNKELSVWLLDWIADMVQDPANPKGCAVVMRGEEGSGKGTLANTIGELFGPHHRHLIDESHLTSNFNAHLLDAVSVFADEITWGGNKKTAGKLKGMVTERHLVGERKGVDAILYRNMVHLMIASNGEWVIPAGSGSRRWFVLDVPADKCKDRKYFDRLTDEIEQGKPAILHYFLNREITSDLRRAPETKALGDQRMLSAQEDTVFHWWRKCLLEGKLPANDLIGQDSDRKDWPTIVSKSELYEAYEMHVINRKDRPVIENVFAKRIKEFGVGMSRPSIGNRRVRVYKIPYIEMAIDRLNKAMPGAIEEDEEDNTDSE